ncbi:hypothetical protein GCM10023214_12130 [Amycolatopsis dongchuanensis]|uniref:DUF4253 domain-containing protein n=2 Tax=Amycolatopsis dongchuanensis TaxID=1070866 RepID=A0ABP9Q263_9PSEU
MGVPADRRDGKNEVMRSEDLHAFARRYLMDRYRDLSDRYTHVRGESDVSSEGEEPSDRRNLPLRYDFAAAALEEIERFDPDHLPVLEELAPALMRAGERAQSTIGEQLRSQEGYETLAEEHELFDAAAASWSAGRVPVIEVPAYRRVLGADESVAWRRGVEQRWGVQGLNWHPMITTQVPDAVLVLRDECMWTADGVNATRRVLRDMGVRRVMELREYGADYEIDVELVALRFAGTESIWTGETPDWIAFASHEQTIALGGEIATLLPQVWPESLRWRWRGW